MNDFSHAFTRPLTRDELIRSVPAAFSDHAAEGTSPQYVFISTAELLDALLDAHFVVTQARQTHIRRSRDAGSARHLLCLQHQRESVTLLDAVPQVILINSHDGRCAWQLRAGLYRPVCTNGLLVRLGDFGLIHVPHRGDVIRNVVDAALAMVREFSRIGCVIERMHHTWLTPDQQYRFAQHALSIRYPGERHWPILAEHLLRPCRQADIGTDVWRVYNVVQENLMHGGIAGWSRTGRATRSRPVQAIREDVRINQALWQLALSMSRSEGADLPNAIRTESSAVH
jgi:hypothetical protein